MDDQEDYDLKAEVGSKRRKLRRLAPLGDEDEDYGGLSSSKATNPANTSDQAGRSVISLEFIF